MLLAVHCRVAVSGCALGEGKWLREEFFLGDAVRVNINGIVVGRSEFTDGDDSYLVQYERPGKAKREWFTAPKLEADA